MTVRRRDFQKIAGLLADFLQKLGEDIECAELRDALNYALLQLQRYYRLLRRCLNNSWISTNVTRISGDSISARTITSHRNPFEDKFTWKWVDLSSAKKLNSGQTCLSPILLASQEGNNSLITQLIEQDSHCLETTDSLGRTALMYAVHSSLLDTIQLLLENGAKIDDAAEDGSTAMHIACQDGNTEAQQLLFQYQANLNLQDNSGRTAVHWSTASQSTDCLQFLLEQKVEADVQDEEGLTPLMWACHYDHADHFKIIREHLYNIKEVAELRRDVSGKTCIHWSVRRSKPTECLKMLLAEDFENVCDSEGKSVVHTAAEMGSLPATEVIVERLGEECIEMRDDLDRTPLILATIGGHGEVVNFLLSKGADLLKVDKYGATAWDYARAKQLHYCMLILASYIRQRGSESPYRQSGSFGQSILGHFNQPVNDDVEIDVNGFNSNTPRPPAERQASPRKLPNHRQHQQTRDVSSHINEQSHVRANPRLGENDASSAFRKVSHQNLNAEGRRGSVGRPENNVGELVDYPSRPSHPGQGRPKTVQDQNKRSEVPGRQMNPVDQHPSEPPRKPVNQVLIRRPSLAPRQPMMKQTRAFTKEPEHYDDYEEEVSSDEASDVNRSYNDGDRMDESEEESDSEHASGNQNHKFSLQHGNSSKSNNVQTTKRVLRSKKKPVYVNAGQAEDFENSSEDDDNPPINQSSSSKRNPGRSDLNPPIYQQYYEEPETMLAEPSNHHQSWKKWKNKKSSSSHEDYRKGPEDYDDQIPRGGKRDGQMLAPPQVQYYVPKSNNNLSQHLTPIQPTTKPKKQKAEFDLTSPPSRPSKPAPTSVPPNAGIQIPSKKHFDRPDGSFSKGQSSSRSPRVTAKSDTPLRYIDKSQMSTHQESPRNCNEASSDESSEDGDYQSKDLANNRGFLKSNSRSPRSVGAPPAMGSVRGFQRLPSGQVSNNPPMQMVDFNKRTLQKATPINSSLLMPNVSALTAKSDAQTDRKYQIPNGQVQLSSRPRPS